MSVDVPSFTRSRVTGGVATPLQTDERIGAMEAKRGDLVAVVSPTSTWTQGVGVTRGERVELGTVTGITRAGVVRTVELADGGTWSRDRAALGAYTLLVPRNRVDESAALAAYMTRRYPTAPQSSMVPPFESVSECKAFVMSFAHAAVSS